ncbi:MAG: CDP-archaeol synthase [Candidatus Saccharimonadales bacterium]
MSWWIALVFFLPAGVANATPVVANKIPLLNKWQTPLDFGISLRGKRLLGKNKSWRGLLTGSVFAGVTALLLSPIVHYSDNWLATFGVGFVLGFGALFGDALESIIKRQHGIEAGHSWFPFDQIDYIIGGLLFVAPFSDLTWQLMALIMVAFFGLHLVFAYIAFKLGLKSKPI